MYSISSTRIPRINLTSQQWLYLFGVLYIPSSSPGHPEFLEAFLFLKSNWYLLCLLPNNRAQPRGAAHPWLACTISCPADRKSVGVDSPERGSTVRSVEVLNREHGKELGTMREWVQQCRENLKCSEKMKALGNC